METTNYYELLESLVRDFGKSSSLYPNNIWKGDLKLNYDFSREETDEHVKFTATITITDTESFATPVSSMTRTLNKLELDLDFIEERGEALKNAVAYQTLMQIFLNGMKNGNI